MRYTVQPYLNTTTDAPVFGYRAGHPLATDDDLRLAVEATSALHAAHAAWTVGNRMGTDLDERAWPGDVRSMSVGDVLVLRADEGQVTVLAVASLGWAEMGEPASPIVPLAGQWAVTSR